MIFNKASYAWGTGIRQPYLLQELVLFFEGIEDNQSTKCFQIQELDYGPGHYSYCTIRPTDCGDGHESQLGSDGASSDYQPLSHTYIYDYNMVKSYNSWCSFRYLCFNHIHCYIHYDQIILKYIFKTMLVII